MIFKNSDNFDAACPGMIMVWEQNFDKCGNTCPTMFAHLSKIGNLELGVSSRLLTNQSLLHSDDKTRLAQNFRDSLIRTSLKMQSFYKFNSILI